MLDGCDNCDEAKINCDDYGEAITFDLAISREKKEKKEKIAEKGRSYIKSSEFIMKSFLGVFFFF